MDSKTTTRTDSGSVLLRKVGVVGFSACRLRIELPHVKSWDSEPAKVSLEILGDFGRNSVH